MSEDKRIVFSTGAQRQASVAGEGQRFPLRYDLIPLEALRRWAETMGEGSLKYSDRNWEKGQPASVLLNHLLAHVYQYMAGDASEDHLGHALFNLGALMHFEKHLPAMIDLPTRHGLSPAPNVEASATSPLEAPTLPHGVASAGRGFITTQPYARTAGTGSTGE